MPHSLSSSPIPPLEFTPVPRELTPTSPGAIRTLEELLDAARVNSGALTKLWNLSPRPVAERRKYPIKLTALEIYLLAQVLTSAPEALFDLVVNELIRVRAQELATADPTAAANPVQLKGLAAPISPVNKVKGTTMEALIGNNLDHWGGTKALRELWDMHYNTVKDRIQHPGKLSVREIYVLAQKLQVPPVDVFNMIINQITKSQELMP